MMKLKNRMLPGLIVAILLTVWQLQSLHEDPLNLLLPTANQSNGDSVSPTRVGDLQNMISLQLPAIAHNGRKSNVSIILGIPTVKRLDGFYLNQTLGSIFDNMTPEDGNDSLVVLMIADPGDKGYIDKVVGFVESNYSPQMALGALEVVVPRAEYYPDMSQLRQTYGDSRQRVQWRSKEILDCSFLMTYAKQRSEYYLHLQDDVITKPRFIQTMKNVTSKLAKENKFWLYIEFCQLGAIGKLFKSSILPVVIQFLWLFYNDKPLDWLLQDISRTMMCDKKQTNNKCKIFHKPSLFQHIGVHSSLKGKIQPLRDHIF